MDFETYKTESLVRIANDPRFEKHHDDIEAILRNRTGHLSIKRGVEVLIGVAGTGKTINYKLFFEACVGGEVKWSRAKMGQVAVFLGAIQRYCADNRLPILTSLVVNAQTGECGDGFFKDLCALGLTAPDDDAHEAAQAQRQASWNWASNC